MLSALRRLQVSAPGSGASSSLSLASTSSGESLVSVKDASPPPPPLPLRPQRTEPVVQIHCVWSRRRGAGKTHIAEQLALTRHPPGMSVLIVDFCSNQDLSKRLLAADQLDDPNRGSVLSFLAKLWEAPPVLQTLAMWHLLPLADQFQSGAAQPQFFCLQAGCTLASSLTQMLAMINDQFHLRRLSPHQAWRELHLHLRDFVERLAAETRRSWTVYVDAPSEGVLADMALASSDSIMIPMDPRKPELLDESLKYLRILLPTRLPEFMRRTLPQELTLYHSFARMCEAHQISLAKVCPVLVGPRAEVLKTIMGVDPEWVRQQTETLRSVLEDPLVMKID